MTRLKRVFQRLLFPAWWIVLVSVPLAAAGLIFVFAPAKRGHWLAYPAYAFSAYALTIVCACIVKNAGHARQDVNAATIYPYSGGFCTKLFSQIFLLTFNCTIFTAFVRKNFGRHKKASHY